MNITLTQKDADYILLYLRSDLQRINDHCDKMHEHAKEYEQIKDKMEKERNSFDLMLLKAFDKRTQEQIDEYDRLYKQHTDTIIKCIELLTIGSTDD